MRSPERLPRRARIRGAAEMATLVRAGRTRNAGSLAVHFREKPGGRTRLGMVVPKYGRPAVVRNRLRRRLREIARREWLAVRRSGAPAVDLLIRVRPQAYDLTFAQLAQALRRGLDGL